MQVVYQPGIRIARCWLQRELSIIRQRV